MSKFKLLLTGLIIWAGSATAQDLAMANTANKTADVAVKGEPKAVKPVALSALMKTIEAGHIIDAKEMIGNGADINQLSADGQTALHFAARKGYIEVVKKLLKEGADTQVRDAQGRTALDVVNQTEYTFPREKRVITRLLSEKN